MLQWRLLLLLAGLMSAGVPVAAQQKRVNQATAASVKSATLQDMLRQPVVLRGSLGAEHIQLSLQPKRDEDGLSGEYFVFGQGKQILLAGEVEYDTLAMEESHDGKDVSGQWDGSLSNGVLSGTWSTPDGVVSKPFSLRVVAP